jgi:hypothetical protein
MIRKGVSSTAPCASVRLKISQNVQGRKAQASTPCSSLAVLIHLPVEESHPGMPVASIERLRMRYAIHALCSQLLWIQELRWWKLVAIPLPPVSC